MAIELFLFPAAVAFVFAVADVAVPVPVALDFVAAVAAAAAAVDFVAAVVAVPVPVPVVVVVAALRWSLTLIADFELCLSASLAASITSIKRTNNGSNMRRGERARNKRRRCERPPMLKAESDI